MCLTVDAYVGYLQWAFYFLFYAMWVLLHYYLLRMGVRLLQLFRSYGHLASHRGEYLIVLAFSLNAVAFVLEFIESFPELFEVNYSDVWCKIRIIRTINN